MTGKNAATHLSISVSLKKSTGCSFLAFAGTYRFTGILCRAWVRADGERASASLQAGACGRHERSESYQGRYGEVDSEEAGQVQRCAGSLLQVERARQQVVDWKGVRYATRPQQDDPRLGCREFGYLLPTAAAGRAVLDVVVSTRDNDRLNRLAAGRDHGRDRVGLRAGAFGISCILDVAAREQFAPVVEERRADTVVRVFCISVLPGGKRCIDQVLFVHVSSFAYDDLRIGLLRCVVQSAFSFEMG